MNSGEKDIYGRTIYLGQRARYIIGPSGTKVYKFKVGPPAPNKRNSAVRTIQKAARGHLQKKSAFMYTMGHNTHIRSLIGNFPRKEGRNLLYKKAELYRKHLFNSIRPIKSGKEIYRGISGKNAENFKERMSRGNKNFNKYTFSSFTRNPKKAVEFSKGSKIVLVLKPYGGLPVVNYTNTTRGLKSKFMNEAEVLLPPGSFKVIGSKRDGYYNVQFKPADRLPALKKETLPRIPLFKNLGNAGAHIINEHNKIWKERRGKQMISSIKSNSVKNNSNGNNGNSNGNNGNSNKNNNSNGNIPSNFTKNEREKYKNFKSNYMANLGNANKAKQSAISNIMAMRKIFGKK